MHSFTTLHGSLSETADSKLADYTSASVPLRVKLTKTQARKKLTNRSSSAYRDELAALRDNYEDQLASIREELGNLQRSKDDEIKGPTTDLSGMSEDPWALKGDP